MSLIVDPSRAYLWTLSGQRPRAADQAAHAATACGIRGGALQGSGMVDCTGLNRYQYHYEVF